jgi:hypothetical protein
MNARLGKKFGKNPEAISRFKQTWAPTFDIGRRILPVKIGEAKLRVPRV